MVTSNAYSDFYYSESALLLQLELVIREQEHQHVIHLLYNNCYRSIVTKNIISTHYIAIIPPNMD